MTPDEVDDVVRQVLAEKVMWLEVNGEQHRRALEDFRERHLALTAEAQELRSRVALLEAELKKARQTSPVESREIRLMDAFGGVA